MIDDALKAQQEVTSISSVKTIDGASEYYDANGRRVNGIQKGKMTIVRMKDGRTIKIRK